MNKGKTTKRTVYKIMVEGGESDQVNYKRTALRLFKKYTKEGWNVEIVPVLEIHYH